MAMIILIVSGCYFLFSQKKVTKEKSRLGNALLRLCHCKAYGHRTLRYVAFVIGVLSVLFFLFPVSKKASGESGQNNGGLVWL
ncbi:hypothetical protein D0C36_05545 [Mucilaginibacter conchicola]|uniref:Uncharacterized protein n=1 Tax=Mucilaginibacter conchicola TaxID=2303333 RepID=A0A372NYM0_9SPHI|nr:hypothetical protein D0C36_05545 [Mucilaginibacter conchicola]